jgi:fibronectin type 3 domain-containing protein
MGISMAMGVFLIHAPKVLAKEYPDPGALVSAPENVDTQLVTDQEIQISWDSQPAAQKYNVYMTRNGIFDDSPATFVGSGTVGYRVLRVRNLNPNTSYFFKVAAIDGFGREGANSDYKIVITKDHPPAPVELKATVSATSTNVRLDYLFGSPASVGFYTLVLYPGDYVSIYRSENNVDFNFINNTPDSYSYIDSGLTPGKTYYYKVKVVRKNGRMSDFSNTVSAKLDAPVTSVDSIKLVSSALSSSEVSLSWNKVDGADSYNIYRNDNLLFPNYKKIANVPSGFVVFSYVDKGLNANTQYSYYVTPYSLTSGEGGQSNITYVTTASSTYTPAPPVVYGPSNLSAAVVTPSSTSKVVLTWDSDRSSYGNVYRSEDGYTYTWIKYVLTGPGYYEDIYVTPGKTYWYKVTGSSDNQRKNESPFSNSVMAVIPGSGPAPLPMPSPLCPYPVSDFIATTFSPNRVLLSWGAPRVDASHPVPENYTIYFGTSPHVWGQVTVSGNQRSYLDTETHPYAGYGIVASTRECFSERTQILGNSGGVVVPRPVVGGSIATSVSSEGIVPLSESLLTESNENSIIEFFDTTDEVVKAGTVATIKYGYMNQTDRTQYIRLTRELVNSSGRVVARTSAIRNVGVDKDFTITARQTFARNLVAGTYTMRVKITDRRTGKIIDQNSFNFQVSR